MQYRSHEWRELILSHETNKVYNLELISSLLCPILFPFGGNNRLSSIYIKMAIADLLNVKYVVSFYGCSDAKFSNNHNEIA